VTEVHQFLPTLAANDAIGMHVLRLRRLLRDAGFASEVFAEDIHDEMRGEALPYRGYRTYVRSATDAWLLYHSSTGSPMAEFLVDQDLPLLIDYHNITDARYFERWAPVIAQRMRDARDQLHRIAPKARFALADSSFNRSELDEAGCPRTAVAPILIDFDDYRAEPHPRTLARLRRQRSRGGARWLFVGRMAPNKCQHDVIAAFATYRKVFDPKARLTLVGGMTARSYWRSLEGLATELELGRDALTLANLVPFPALLAHYRTADVFVCLSEHEGFNVPVLEAMHFGVPVVAYAATATPETVGDAGLLLADKDPLVLATAVDRVIQDRDLRATLCDAGRRRVEHFSLANSGRRTIDAITSFLADSRDGGADSGTAGVAGG